MRRLIHKELSRWGGHCRPTASRPRALLLVLAAGLCLAQSSSDLLTPAIRRVGGTLACLCGSCKNTVATCQMLGCHYSSPARERIAKMQAAGMTDEAVIDDFVKREGKRALAVPPAEGFNLLSWVMPFVAIAIGLVAIYLYVKRYRKPAASPPVVDNAALERYHEEIENDLAKLE
ncbi:MAG: cytochrome c-type biogenesis protein CcmH [Acidobacteria bacterium]|nr:cytochrome c-type biogenesis protein CcmH [Acidobacteriota bacterium]